MPKTLFFGDFQPGHGLNLASIDLKRHLQHESMPFFPQALRFRNSVCQACAEIKISRLYLFSCQSFFLFFYFRIILLDSLTFYRASFKFETFRESNFETGNFYRREARCSRHKFATRFSLKFLSIFVYIISDSIEPITRIWVSLERSFPSVEFK